MVMRMLKHVLTASVAVALFVSAHASNVVGKWTGTVVIGGSPQAEAQMKQAAGKLPGVVLEIKADKTCKATQSGGQGGSHVSEGIWTMSGNKVTITPKKRDGKPATAEGARSR